MNKLFTKFPSAHGIKETIFNLKKDGAYGPDGFRAFFFRHYWSIIHQDVINVVL